MNDDISAIRERCATLEELIQHAEADGLALHMALQEAIDHLGRVQWPDEVTMQRWLEALSVFAGSPLLLERAAARALGDAAAAWYMASKAAEVNPTPEHQQALAYAVERLGARLMAYERVRLGALVPVEQEATDAAALLKRLSPREREVLDLVTDGLTNPQIAVRLGVRPGTAKIHIEHLLSKLGATNRTQAAAIVAAAERQRLVQQAEMDLARQLIVRLLAQRTPGGPCPICKSAADVPHAEDCLLAAWRIATGSAQAASADTDPMRATDRDRIRQEMDRLFGKEGRE
jgi:DNA-binding CsgD family transcriptional regulator